jgi:cytochrome c peroxidase
VQRTTNALLLSLGALISGAALAGPREDQLAQYATAAKQANPAFAAFSAARGEALFQQKFSGGKPDTPSCTSCHASSPRSAGRSPVGKVIEPMAVSATPTRYTDAAKVEKWFKRNCTEVIGRECTAQEKGDWLSYMLGQ